MSDLALMARLAAGDQGAVAELYDRYGAQVYALAHRMLQEQPAAEDVTQEVFLKLWQTAGKFDPERGRPATWVLHLAYTTTVDMLRLRRRTTPSRFTELPLEPDATADTAGEAEVAVLGAQVKSALMHLPAEQRQVLEMSYFGFLPQQAIATLLGVPLGTVKGRVRLGLDSLRQQLLAPRRKEAGTHVKLSPRR